MCDFVREEMTKYYRKMDMKGWMNFQDKEVGEKYSAEYDRIFRDMDAFYHRNPNLAPALLKSKLHMLMAEYCEPVIFLENPFFFELEYNHSRSRGLGKNTPSSWLMRTKNRELLETCPAYAETTAQFLPYFDRETNNLCSHYDTFDHDHHTLGYTELFATGVRGLIEKTEAKRRTLKEGTEEYDYCTAVIESCRAVLVIAHKFADKAERLLSQCSEERQRANLQLIAGTARKIPEYPPETFYEGLTMILFMREVTATLENIAISQLGHVDRLLGELYHRDLESGRINEAQARQLISVWMMHTDVKFDVQNNKWPESSTCIQLGGCDPTGRTVFNDVTKMFIEEHLRLKLLSPKLNCRFTESSPDEYLKLIGRTMLEGHNNFALFNDDMIIPSLMESGVSESDARLYVNGGCQEMMIEGLGHTEGTAFYISLLRFFDVFLRGDETAQMIAHIRSADSFEAFYEAFIGEFKDFLNAVIDQRNFRQSFYKNAVAYPLFSATQDGCIQSGRDYIQGGARYNFSTVALVGLANTVDSLYSIKTLVYDQKRLSLKAFSEILAGNWDGYEAFRREVLALPKYGHNHKEADALANRCFCDVANLIKSRKNERGGIYLPSIFVYSFNRTFAPCLRATPDGRKNYEYIAAGCGPSAAKALKDITKPIKSLRSIDLSACGGGVAVLDVMLPASSELDEDRLCALIRACGKSGIVALQPNVVSRDTLLDAKANPENYKSLIVRVCGLSAYFTALAPDVQDELIQRNFYS